MANAGVESFVMEDEVPKFLYEISDIGQNHRNHQRAQLCPILGA